jgi:hypothetical protein
MSMSVITATTYATAGEGTDNRARPDERQRVKVHLKKKKRRFREQVEGSKWRRLGIGSLRDDLRFRLRIPRRLN